MNLTDEMLEKAKQAKSAEELLAIAKENSVELSADEAAEYFAQLHKTGELSDEELDNVTGAGICDKEEEVETHKYNKGDKVRFGAKPGDAKTRYGIINFFMGYADTYGADERYDISETDETFTVVISHFPIVTDDCIKHA